MSTLKVIIAGGRTYNDYARVCEYCDFVLADKLPDVEIVHGGAKGADALGKRYGEERGLAVKEFPADWDKHGKSAGPIRNAQMADYADALIAFWDRKSPGTKNMIAVAGDRQLKLRIVITE